LRINSAKDDTAGLAISERMNNQVRGMQQANRNVQQANNMRQTAEGAMHEISNILGQMRELAVQSASDGGDVDDRTSIDLEFQQLKAEITRIGDGTEYNNMKLINGDRAKVKVTPVGTDAVGSAIAGASDVQIASHTVNEEYTFYAVPTGPDYLEVTLAGDTTSATETVALVRGFQDGDEIHFDELGIAVLVADISDLHGKKLKVGRG